MSLDISNDSLWSHMMTIYVSALTYRGFNHDLKGQKLVKDTPRIAHFLKCPENQTLVPFILCLETPIILYGYV